MRKAACTPNGVTNGADRQSVVQPGRTLGGGETATVTVVVRPSIATTGNRVNTAIVTSPDVGDPIGTTTRLGDEPGDRGRGRDGDQDGHARSGAGRHAADLRDRRRETTGRPPRRPS